MYRLYRPEWVIVHTVHAAGNDARPCFELARQWAIEHVEQDIRDDNRVQLEMFTNQVGNYWAHIKVLTNNLKGEYLSRDAATMSARIKDYDEYVIVAKDSKDDLDMRRYGVRTR